MSKTDRQVAIVEALTVFDKGLTVMELSTLLDRTGGDITKGVSNLRSTRNIKAEILISEHNRKTVRYTMEQATES
jgi:hypothetical protein